MRVTIDQPRQYRCIAQINDLGPLWDADGSTDRNDRISLDQNDLVVQNRSAGNVNEAPSFNGLHLRLCMRRIGTCKTYDCQEQDCSFHDGVFDVEVILKSAQ